MIRVSRRMVAWGGADGVLLLLLVFAPVVLCEEEAEPDPEPDPEQVYFEKRMAEAVARGGEKERHRVLLDDLAAWVDERAEGYAYQRELLSHVLKLELLDAVPLIKTFLNDRDWPNADTGDNDPDAELFKTASDVWLRLKSLQMTPEQRALYALRCISYAEELAPHLAPPSVRELIEAAPTAPVRKALFDYVTDTQTPLKRIWENPQTIGWVREVELLLQGRSLLAARDEEVELWLRGPTDLARLVANGLLCARKSERVLPTLLEWLAKEDSPESKWALVRMGSFSDAKFREGFLSVAEVKLRQYPLDLSEGKEKDFVKRDYWLRFACHVGKDPISLRLLRAEQQAIQEIDPFKYPELSQKRWKRLYDLKSLVERTLAEWEKK